MESLKTILYVINKNQTIQIKEDNEFNGFAYFIEHRKHKNIIYVFKDVNLNQKWAYCLKCQKFISNQTSNICKHQNSVHKTFIEQIENINKKIIKLLIEVNAPISIVEKKEFREIFPTFYKDKATYDNQLDLIYNEIFMNIKNYLYSTESINLYVDEWSRFGLNFVGIFCSTYEKDALLACGVPDSLSRNSISISKYILENISKFHITNKIKFCSTDCAPNIANAITNLDVEWNPCCCHVINKAVEKALDKISILKNILKKVNILNKSTKLKQYMLMKNEDFLIVPSFSQTRWLSVGNILKRLIQKQHAITTFLNSNYNINNIEFNDIEWTTISILNNIVNDINIELISLESNNKTGFFNAILLIIKIMIHSSEQFRSNGFNEAGDILHSYMLEKLLKYPNWTKNMLVAAHLNPNISIDDVLPIELKEISDNSIKYILQRIPALNEDRPNNLSFGARIVNTKENQYQSYLKMPYSGTVDVYEYWITHKYDLPDLFTIAKSFFGLYPSSSCIERGFSMAKNVLEDKFGAISPENAEKRIFIYVNSDFISK